MAANPFVWSCHMIKELFFTTALLAPVLAYGASPTANLSVTIVPPSQGGCLSDSICPAGATWTNVIDEQMSKGYLSSLFSPTGRCGSAGTCVLNGNTWEDNSQALSWSSCCAVISYWNANGAPNNTNNYPGGGEISTYANYGYGYYEIKEIAGTTWSAFWIPGDSGGCPANIGDGAEFDIQENYFGSRLQTNVIYGGYGACMTQQQHTLSGVDPNVVHIYGLDWSPTRGITYYTDGVQVFHLNPPVPANAAPILASAGYVNGNPQQIYWIRYYKGTPE
jgi:hypothetical protein